MNENEFKEAWLDMSKGTIKLDPEDDEKLFTVNVLIHGRIVDSNGKTVPLTPGCKLVID